MNVRYKVLGGFLAAAALIGISGEVVLREDRASTENAAITDAQQVASGIANDVAIGAQIDVLGKSTQPLYQNYWALTDYLERLQSLQNREIIVIDTSTRIRGNGKANTGVGNLYQADPGGEVKATIADRKPRHFLEHRDGGTTLRQVVVPMIDSNKKVEGAIVLEYTAVYNQMVASTAHARDTIVAVNVACGLLVLLFGALIAWSITRRILGLTRAIQVIRTGDYSQRFTIGGRDEISRLGDAVNDLAGRLERSAREILAKEYTDSILASAGEGICGVDPNGRITFANEAAGRITGLGVFGLLGTEATTLVPGTDTEGEVTLTRQDGSTVRVAYTVSTITKDEHRIGGVIVLRDVSRQRALEHDLRHQALHDTLTGLPNRRLFLDRLEQAVRGAREDGPGAGIGVLYLDLDGFKKVNDSLGHNAGDLLLRTAADRLRGALREHDTIARLGGDEFAVLLIDAPADVVEACAQACVDALENPFLIHGRTANVSVSVGLIADAARFADADEVLRNADVAMYAAKAHGKGCYQVFEPSMHEQLLDRLDRESRLREAIHGGGLRLHLQPVVDLETSELRGVEALVRWQDPEFGLRLPADFIPLAEETGLVTEIDRWMLFEACQTVKKWQDEQPSLAPQWVSVNLSAANLDVPDLTDRVAYVLATTGLAASSLVLELTETVLIRDIEGTSARLAELRELGVRIAIDDFGTGYSSLGYLRDIPADVLKVDRSFVAGLDGDDRRRDLVSAVVQLGHTLGLKVVAEGVETAAEMSGLAEMGCRYAQGYHLGRPVPAADLVNPPLPVA